MSDDPNGDTASVVDTNACVAARLADAAVRQALVESHRQVLAFLQRRIGRVDEAEDVLQSFILRAIERSAQLRDVRTVRGWLSRILATTIADHQRRSIRRHQREIVIDQEDLEDFPIDADGDLDVAICGCLDKLLPTLRPEYAAVLRRIDLLGEPRGQVAASLGITLNNVTVRLHRGRQALKTRIEEMCLTCPVHGVLDCRCEQAERARRARQGLDCASDL